MSSAEKTVEKKNGRYILTGIPHTGSQYTIRGLEWCRELKRYICPATPGNAKVLQLLGFPPPPAPVENTGVVAVMPTKNTLRLPIAGKLRKYQLEGACQMEAWQGRALLADEMGLGKTIQVLAWFLAHLERRPVLVVCPACAKFNWLDEIEKWCPREKAMVLQGRTPGPLPADVQYFIVNYDILGAWLEALDAVKLEGVAIDEAHYIRNHIKGGSRGRKKVQRTDAVLKVCRGVPHIIAMTGSPVVNRPMDLFVVLKLLRPLLFPNKFEFGMQFCDPVLDKYTGKLEFKGCTEPEKLHALLINNVMIRRLKKDVLPDLPAKQRTLLKMELSNAAEYRRQERDTGETAAVLVARLRQLSALGKLEDVFEWIDNSLETGEKLIVFVHHRAVGEALAARYPKCSVSYRGGLTDARRWETVQLFQKNPACRLFIGSITACGVAINLTAASNVLFIEFPWTPAEVNQCEDRAHRLGQLNSVNVYYAVVPNTIDEDMFEVLIGKAGMAGAVLDGKGSAEDTAKAVVQRMFKRLSAAGK